MKKEIKPGQKKETPQKKSTIKERIRKHISDKNDVITDEDIRDAVVGAAATEELQKETEDIINEIPKKKKTTPWNILEDDAKE